jgi:bisphosphoglycerate-dependent phosphoglycerate mutase
MKKLPIDLPLKTVTTKISVAAEQRAQELKKELGCRLSDVYSAALLYADVALLRRIMDDQKVALDALPKSVQAVLKNLDKLSDADRKALRDLLDQ